MKEQKKNKGSVLVAESAYNSQNAQFALVMIIITKFFLLLNFFSIDLLICFDSNILIV